MLSQDYCVSTSRCRPSATQAAWSTIRIVSPFRVMGLHREVIREDVETVQKMATEEDE
jgi:hypothetical protein